MVPLAVIIVVALVLLVLGFVAPRWSRKPQGKVDKGLNKGKQKTSHAPGKAGDVMPKPLDLSEKIADKAADAGRSAREKLDG